MLGIAPYFDTDFYVGYNLARYELALDPHADPARGVLTYWGVADAETAHRRLVEAGATAEGSVQDVGTVSGPLRSLCRTAAASSQSSRTRTSSFPTTRVTRARWRQAPVDEHLPDLKLDDTNGGTVAGVRGGVLDGEVDGGVVGVPDVHVHGDLRA